MEPPGMKYTAVRDLDYPPGSGTFAYRAGQLVPAAAVIGDGEAADGAWLALGTDVEPREAVHLDRPAANASQTAWAAYAIGEGADPDEAIAMSRADLIREYGG